MANRCNHGRNKNEKYPGSGESEYRHQCLAHCFGFRIHVNVRGLLTSGSVSVHWSVLSVAGCVGGSRNISSRDTKQNWVGVFEAKPNHNKAPRLVEPRAHRTRTLRGWLPLKPYRYRRNSRVAVAGDSSEAVLACTYGVLKRKHLYPITPCRRVYAESLTLRAPPTPPRPTLGSLFTGAGPFRARV